eukprot:COSAG02_NODE_2900_length_7779_cov_3.635547_2_plen_56_part_00
MFGCSIVFQINSRRPGSESSKSLRDVSTVYTPYVGCIQYTMNAVQLYSNTWVATS